MEDDDGTCLLDVLCDPQALNDFLHGTNELPTEDLLINSSSGEASLFADAPSPGSLLGDGVDSPDSPTPGCVDLSFLEEALLSSLEPEEDPPLGPGGTVLDQEPKKVEEAEEAQVACDILQQSLQEADITEQTMALEAGLSQSGDTLSLYSPAPLLPPHILSYGSKSVSLPVTPALPRDTQAAVDPPQPSLLAVGPGCPSLKPAAPPQLMGLLPGNVFPAASPEISLSPANGSSVILHKALPSVQTRPIITQTLRAGPTPAPGIVLQRASLPIQPKLPITIQPRLVQISPKPSGQKPAPGLTFVSGTATPNILLSQPGAQKPAPVPQSGPQLPKPVSLQLVNQAGSFVLQPQGLFHGQNQFLLPGQVPVTIPQPTVGSRQLLTSQGHAVHTVAPSGQLVDGSQILTVPQRQLNFSPVFTTPTGQLALRQATLLSGPLQLQSAPPTVFQMPAQLTGTYAAGAQAPRATLVHSPAIGNHITLINSSGVLPPDLTSFSIVNGPSVFQGLPFTHTPVSQTTVTEAQLGLQQASVVLLPERAIPDERGGEEAFHLTQSYGQVLQQVSVQPSAAQRPSTPPVVTVLQPPPDPPLAPEPAVDMPKLLMASADISQVVEEVTQLSQNQAFMQQLQQQALQSPLSSELLVGSLPVVPLEALSSPLDGDSQVKAEDVPSVTDQCVEGSPLTSHPDSPLLCSSPSPTDQTQTFTPPEQITSAPPSQTEPSVQYQLQGPQALFPPQQQVQIQTSTPQPLPQLHIHSELSQTQPQAALSQSQVHIQIHDGPQSLPQVQPHTTPLQTFMSQTSMSQTSMSLSQTQTSIFQALSRTPLSKMSLSETSVSQSQSLSQPQASLQTSMSQSLSQVQTSMSHVHLQPPPQSSLLPSASSRSPSPAPVQRSVSVPQLQPGPRAAPSVSSGEQPAVQQHTLNKPTAALVVEGTAFTIKAHVPSPLAQTVPGHALSNPRDTPILTAQLSQHTDNKLEIVPEQRPGQLTPAQRRHRFQQQICADHTAVQRPSTTAAFCSFQDAVRGLLPYHSCTGPLPSQEHFHQVDQEFDTVSGFLLKRTKDMVNKYRQLLLREALQDIPSAEMVMLERLFLQAERFTLAEDRRRARRDPESFATAPSSSSSSSPSDALPSASPLPPPPLPPLPPLPPSLPPSLPPAPSSSSSPSSPPSWTRLTDRPPGLRTYRSSSRGGLRLTIKHESGSRKVVHNSALKRDHSGQLTNGGRHCQTSNNTHPVSNGSVEEVPPTDFKIKAPVNFEIPSKEVSAPKLKCYRLDTPPDQPIPAIQEDNILSEHLQSAIDSILELQRLQGPSASQNRGTAGVSLDQAVTSILEGHL